MPASPGGVFVYTLRMEFLGGDGALHNGREGTAQEDRGPVLDRDRAHERLKTFPRASPQRAEAVAALAQLPGPGGSADERRGQIH